VIDQAARFLRSSSRLPLLAHPSSTPLALLIYERFLEELRTSRSWINAPSANPLMTRAMRIPCGSKFAPHISPVTKSSHEYKNRNTRRGFLDVDPRVAVSLIVVGILVAPSRPKPYSSHQTSTISGPRCPRYSQVVAQPESERDASTRPRLGHEFNSVYQSSRPLN